MTGHDVTRACGASRDPASFEDGVPAFSSLGCRGAKTDDFGCSDSGAESSRVDAPLNSQTIVRNARVLFG